MFPIPDDILKPFDAVMEKKAIPPSLRSDYRKWLKYYLDFRIKYPPPDSRSEQVRLFIEKLRTKNQPQKNWSKLHTLCRFFLRLSRGRDGHLRLLTMLYPCPYPRFNHNGTGKVQTYRFHPALSRSPP
jgi:hypothetical protein